MTATLTVDIPAEVDDKTRTGISAILRAIEDVRAGRLVCPCSAPECELRRLTEETSLDGL